jgi:hypothetical protein
MNLPLDIISATDTLPVLYRGIMMKLRCFKLPNFHWFYDFETAKIYDSCMRTRLYIFHSIYGCHPWLIAVGRCSFSKSYLTNLIGMRTDHHCITTSPATIMITPSRNTVRKSNWVEWRTLASSFRFRRIFDRRQADFSYHSILPIQYHFFLVKGETMLRGLVWLISTLADHLPLDVLT